MILKPLFRKQDGIALIMSIGTLAVLTIAGTTAMTYTTSNTRTAGRSQRDEASFSLS
jgi:Tfp pilus assembly protein PilX